MIAARAERLVSADGTRNRFTGYPAGTQQLSKLSAEFLLGAKHRIWDLQKYLNTHRGKGSCWR